MPGKKIRRIPIEAKRILRGGFARANGGNVSRLQISAPHVSILRGEVDQLPVKGIKPADKTITARHGDVILIDNTAGHGKARSMPGTIILEPAGNIVGKRGRNIHMVKLPDGHMVQVIPVFTGIIGLIDTSITTSDHVSPVAF